MLPDECLVKENPDCKKISSAVDVMFGPSELFRSEISRRTDLGAVARPGKIRESKMPRETKIDQDRRTIRLYPHVAWLEIAMDYLQFCQRRETIAELREKTACRT